MLDLLFYHMKVCSLISYDHIHSYMFFAYIGTLDVTHDACPCKFATTMQLPCRHMLAVREKKGLSLYREDGIADRWKILYMQQVFNNKRGDDPIMASDSYQVKLK